MPLSQYNHNASRHMCLFFIVTAGFDGCCHDAGLASGAMEKLADIISPAPEDAPTADAIWEKLQRGLKGAQAVLEKGQASAFGEQARTPCSLCACALVSHFPPNHPWHMLMHCSSFTVSHIVYVC